MNTNPIVRLVSLLLAGLVAASSSAAEDFLVEGQPLRERSVSLSEIPSLINGQWQIVRRAEWERLLESCRTNRQTPGPARITEAVYSAVLAGDRWEAGTLQISIERLKDRPGLLRLDPLSLPVQSLRWSDTEAIWGTTSQGETVAYLDRPAGTLKGLWSLSGQQRRNSLEFGFRLAPAEISRLELRLPVDRVLKCDVGIVTQSARSDPKAEWTDWTVQLGRTHECSLLVTRRGSEGSDPPLLMTDQTTRLIIKDDGIDLQEDLQLDVLNDPIDRVDLEIPATAQVFSVTYGVDTPLRWEQSTAENGREVRVFLPDPVRGKLQRIRLNGFAPLTIDSKFSIPRVRVIRGIFERGRVQLEIHRPLQLNQFQPDGLFQTRAVLDATNIETMGFQQFLPESDLAIRIGLPKPIVSGRVFSHIHLGAEAWELRSQIDWKRSSGQVFQCRCDLAPGWNVTGVRLAPGNEETQIVYWNSRLLTGGDLMLTVEFSNDLPATAARSILVDATRTPDSGASSLRLPVLRPSGTNGLSYTIALTEGSEGRVDPVGTGQGFRVLPIDEVPSWVRESFRWDGVLSRSARPTILVSESGFANREIGLTSDTGTMTGSASVLLTVDEQRAVGFFSVKVRSLSDPLSRFVLFLTSRDHEPKWSISGANGQQGSFRRLTDSELLANRLPVLGSGWEVTLKTPVTTGLEISGTCEIKRQGDIAVPLPVIHDVRSFQGIVELDRRRDPGVEIVTEQLLLRETAGDQDVMEYSSANATMSLRIPVERNDSQIASLEMYSQIAVEEDSYDIHWARFLVRGRGAREFRFSMDEPAQLIATRINGAVSQPVGREGEFLLSDLSEERENIVELEYRTPSRTGFLESRRKIVLPRTNHEIVSFQWEFALPVEYSVVNDLSSIQLAFSPESRSWTQRLFGPLGRRPQEPFFNPLNASSWSFLYRDSNNMVSEESNDDRQVATTGWIVWRATGQTAPSSVTLGAIDQRRTSLCAWLAMLICGMVGLFIRMFGYRQRFRIGALWLVLITSCSLVVLSHIGEIAGGAVVGTVVSSLLPRTLIRRLRNVFGVSIVNPMVPDGLAVVRTAGLLLVIVSWFLGRMVVAQDRETQSQGQTDSPISRAALPEEILVPVRPVEPDSVAWEPVVYVHRSTWNALLDESRNRGSQSLDYLLMGSRYDCRLTENSAVIEATFRIALIGPESSIDVRIPISGASLGGPEACRINGQSATATLTVDGSALELKVNRSNPISSLVPTELPQAEPMTQQPSAQTRSARDYPVPFQAVEFVEVQLDLYPPSQLLQSEQRLALEIPPVVDTLLTVESPAGFPRVNVETGVEHRTLGSSENVDGNSDFPPRILLGRVDQLLLSWRNSRPLEDQSVEWHAVEKTIVDLSFTSLNYSSLVEFTPVQGSLEEVILSLPVDSIGVELESPQVQSRQLVMEESATMLVLELDDPQDKAFTIGVRWKVPRKTSASPLNLRTPHLLAAMPDVRSQGNRLGITVGPSFEVVPVIPESSGYTMSSDALRIGERPSIHTYDVQSESELEFQLAVKKPIRRIFQNQQGEIHGYGIDWLVTAEIQIEETAAFQHRLSVDRRLLIESVSVQEDGADRLVRWDRSGETVTLYLRGKTQGLQNLRLKAHLPVTNGKSSRLPNVRFEDAEIIESTLTLIQDSDLVVEFTPPLPQTAEPADSGMVVESSTMIGQYAVEELGKLPQCRIRLRDRSIRGDALLSIAPDEQSRWSFGLEIRFPVTDSLPPRFRLAVPGILAANLEVDSSRLPFEIFRDPEGNRVVSVGPFPSDGEPLILRIQSSWIPDDPLRIDVPPLTVSHAVDGVTLGMIGGAEAPVALDSNVGVVARDAVQGLFRGSPLLGLNMATVRFLRIPRLDQRWWFEPGGADAREAGWVISLMETEIRMAPQGAIVGRTRLFPDNETSGEELQLEWPSGLVVQSVFVNDEVRSFEPPGESRLLKFTLTSPLPANGLPQRVDVFWRSQSADSNLFRNPDLKIPVPKQASVDLSLVTIGIPEENRLLLREGLDEIDAASFLAQRLRALQQYCEKCEASGGLAPALQRAFRQQILTTRQDLQRPLEREWTPEEKARLTSALVSAEQWYDTLLADKGLIAEERGLSDQDFVSLGSVTSSSISVARGEINAGQVNPRIQVWLVDDRIPLGTGLVLICPLAVWFLFKLVDQRMTDWLDQHPGITWMAIGLLWWSCFSPGFPGFVICVTGFWITLRQAGLRKRSNQQHLPARV